MPGVITKRPLSGSTDGKAISVTATSIGSGNTIHAAIDDAQDNDLDEIWLYAYNNHSADVVLTLGVGGTSHPNLILHTIPTQAGLYLVLPGLVLRNGATIVASAGTTAVIAISGYVHRIDY